MEVYDNLEVETKEKLIKDIRCYFCRKNDGFLKKLKERKDKWTHVQCMKWFMSIKLYFENGYSMFKIDKDLPGYIWMGECSYCNKTQKGDFFVKCKRESCDKCFHSKCVLNSPLKNMLEEVSAEKNLKYYIIHCEEHSISII